MKVTPWEVSGKIDYSKLIEEFGTSKISSAILAEIKNTAKELPVLLRRGYFFSHRDLDKILHDYKSGKGFFLYTGRGPSGDMHLGHLLSFELVSWMQKKFNVNVYIEITDDEKFWHKKDLSFEKVQEQADSDILDIIAVGFDPDKTFIFKNSEYVKNAYPLIMKAAKKVNFSTAKAVFGFNNDSNLGIIFYPIYQIAVTFFEKKRCLIPCGIDQDPYWRVQRDIAESLGFFKTAAIHSALLPPLTGIEGKMSSSIPESAIYLKDDEKTVEKKIMKYAFSGGRSTIEEHRKLGADLNVDVPFAWLSMFFEDDDAVLEKIKKDYSSGKMLSGEVKKHLSGKINSYLKEHRRKRKEAEKTKSLFMHEGKLAKEMWKKTY